MKSGTKKNLNRRARKILARIKKFGEKDSLLDLTPLTEQESRVFLVSEEDKIRRLAAGVWEDLANSFKGIDLSVQAFGMALHKGLSKTIILNGNLIPPPVFSTKKIPWPKCKEGQIVGLRGDFMMIDDPLNYPLTDAEETLNLVKQGDKTK